MLSRAFSLPYATKPGYPKRNTGDEFSESKRELSTLISIVIPTKNSESTLEYSLQSINQQTIRDFEIIIVDNNSTDRTKEIARKYTDRIFTMGPERTAQVNFGIRQAKGRYIYRLDSDMVLEPTVLEEAIWRSDEGNYDAIYIPLTADPTISFWAKVKKFERDMYHEDDLNIAVRFIKKEIFDKVGYFDESLVASEDYDLHNRIVAAGYKVGRIKSKEIHLGEPKSIMEIIRKHYYYGTTLHAFLSKNHEKGLKQLSPLRPAYAKHWKEFVLHPITALGFVVYQIVRYPSAILGYTVVAISKANRRALRVDTH